MSTRARALTVFVNLSFTFYARGLFAGNWLSRANTSLCYYNVCVYYTNPSSLQQVAVLEYFGVIATNGSCCVCCVARVRAVGFPHMIRSSRRIVEDDRGVAAEEPSRRKRALRRECF